MSSLVDFVIFCCHSVHILSESGSIRPHFIAIIIIDKVFFNNFLAIIDLLVVCKKNNNSFILVYFNYLFIGCIQKK
jgi:hypothetical protein